MNNSQIISDRKPGAIAKLPLLAAVVALIGICDAIYLTYHHYTAEPVPCTITGGCEQVLNSYWADIYGIPLALFGALAYLLLFVLALLAAFGKRAAWTIYGIQVTLMFAFTAWLIYLQAYVIEAFCQFCLLSAATTTTLFIIFIISKIFRRG